MWLSERPFLQIYFKSEIENVMKLKKEAKGNLPCSPPAQQSLEMQMNEIKKENVALKALHDQDRHLIMQMKKENGHLRAQQVAPRRVA